MGLEKDFAREIAALEESGAALPLLLSPGEAMIVLCQLQLALRHPLNTGSGAEFARTLALNLQERLCADRPAMQEVAERGWREMREEHAKWTASSLVCLIGPK